MFIPSFTELSQRLFILWLHKGTYSMVSKTEKISGKQKLAYAEKFFNMASKGQRKNIFDLLQGRFSNIEEGEVIYDYSNGPENQPNCSKASKGSRSRSDSEAQPPKSFRLYCTVTFTQPF